MKGRVELVCPRCRKDLAVRPEQKLARCACGHEWQWKEAPKLVRLAEAGR